MGSVPTRCERCAKGGRDRFDADIEMAYQPIVDLRSRAIFAHEALVRGPEGEGAASVLAQVTEKNRYRFDQACRIKAIETAAGLGLKEAISINFMPNAVYEPRNCIQATLWAADKYDIAPEQIIFEITEGEEITDLDHLKRIVTEYKHQGFRTAIDDFGAGYSGLSLLADLQPDLIKLDMRLIRHIDTDSVRQKILSGMLSVANSLGIVVVAEGIETEGEREALSGLGIELMQGFLFGRPKFRGARTLDSISFEPPIAA